MLISSQRKRATKVMNDVLQRLKQRKLCNGESLDTGTSIALTFYQLAIDQ